MALTLGQLSTLKIDITVTRAAVSYDGQTLLQWWNAFADTKLAEFYNQFANPNYYVWKSTVAIPDLMRGGFDWTRVDNLTVGKARIWEFMTSAGTVNPSEPNVRAGFEATFAVEAGDQPCRQAIYNGASRLARYGEALYTVGTGTAPTHHGIGPAVLTFEGVITPTDVGQSRSA